MRRAHDTAGQPRITTRVIDPAALSPSARAGLLDALYVSHCEVFDGVDRAEFEAYVCNPSARMTRLLVLYDPAGRVRGYCALHGFVQRHLGRQTLVIRAEVAAEKGWRRRGFAGPFVAQTLTAFRMRYLALPAYFFACFVHPSAYVSLCRHAPEVWPRPDRETPVKMRALLHSLTRQFDIEARDGIAQVGWISRGDSAPKTLDPLAEYYLQRNPGYVHGQGLMTVLPLRSVGLAVGIAHMARHRWQRRQRAGQGGRARSPRPAWGRAHGIARR